MRCMRLGCAAEGTIAYRLRFNEGLVGSRGNINEARDRIWFCPRHYEEFIVEAGPEQALRPAGRRARRT